MEDPKDNDTSNALTEFKIERFRDGQAFPVDDVVAREEPLEIRLNGRTLVYLMRLPGDDVLLAVGFCNSEGLISERREIDLIQHCVDGDFDSQAPDGAGDGGAGPGNLVEIKAQIKDESERFATARVIRTGCGGADLEHEIDLDKVRVTSEKVFDPQVILKAPDQLLAAQEVFKVSGGTHGAGLFDAEGNMLVVKEDVGRHNAVDKVLGHLLMYGIDPAETGLVLSGRLSYEMVLKAARAGVPLLCSVSAPTALGVEVGRITGVTLVGFLRGAGFNIYSHPRRIGG